MMKTRTNEVHLEVEGREVEFIHLAGHFWRSQSVPRYYIKLIGDDWQIYTQPRGCFDPRVIRSLSRSEIQMIEQQNGE